MDRIASRIREVALRRRSRSSGHTDTIGKLDYNVACPKKRAETACNLILASGITAKGAGCLEGKGPVDRSRQRPAEGRASINGHG